MKAGVVAIGLSLCAAVAEAQTPTIVFGTQHAVALRNNGEVLTWGDNVTCQLGRPSGNRGEPAVIMRNVKEIAAGATHTLALTTDGKVYGWGGNAYGQLGVGDTYEKCEGPALVTSLEDKSITHIATGIGFSLAVSSTGDLFCTGDNSMLQCPPAKGGRSEVFVQVAFPELAGKVDRIAAGLFHALVLTNDGKLYAFGRGRDGQLGDGRSVNGFAAIPAMTDVVSMAAGTWHSVVARSDGSAWAWGNDSKSQLCDGRTVNLAVPTRIGSLPPQAKIASVAAGGLSTVLRTSEGALFACGDNQFGHLGVGAPATVSQPVQIPVPVTKTLLVSVGGGNAAVSADGCAVQLSGLNNNAVVGGTSADARVFTPRANLTLCGTRPAAPLPTLVREWPRGGRSGCWATPVEENASRNAQFAGVRQAMLTAESILKKNAVFMAALEPVRYRSSFSAGPSNESGATLHVKVVPERKLDGTRVWAADCDVITQIDRIGGAIHQISIYFNLDARVHFVPQSGGLPKLTGRVGGYPEYNNVVLITKDGRLPWIYETLADRLDVIGARRDRALADWNRERANRKALDPAAMQKSYEMLKKTDPAGAENMMKAVKEQAEEFQRWQQEVVPARTAALEKRVTDYRTYRASFSADDLRAPAVLGDPSGEAKKQADAKIAALRNLTPAEQKQADEWGAQSRALERQAQAEAKTNAAEAPRLRGQANELGLKVRALRQAHTERVSYEIDDINAQYELANLKPGAADKAIGVKRDPTFPDTSDLNRIQVIEVLFSVDPDPKNTARREWQQKVKDSFDFAALAALLK